MRAVRPALHLAFLLLASVAGCLGTGPDAPPDPGDVTPPPTPAEDRRPTAERPTFAVGDWWEYEARAEGFPTHEVKHVVYKDEADLVWLGTDDRDYALLHAVFSVSPVLGRISKETLSPYQGGEPVEMYRFPLEDEKTWTGPFFGRDMTFTVAYREKISTPKGELPGFTVVAIAPDRFTVTYDYVEAIRWFTVFSVFDEKGFELFDVRLKGLGTGYHGDAYFLRGRDLYQRFEFPDRAGSITDRFAVQGDFQSIAISAEVTSEVTAKLTIKDPAGRTQLERQASLRTDQKLDVREVTASGGSWNVEFLHAGRSGYRVWVAGVQEFHERI
ncbi:MAG: hypothetical protein ACT4PT_01310 [Methanobacteriota archaeon]